MWNVMLDPLVTSLKDNNSIQLQKAFLVGWVAIRSQQTMDHILVKLSLKVITLLQFIFPWAQKEIIKNNPKP